MVVVGFFSIFALNLYPYYFKNGDASVTVYHYVIFSMWLITWGKCVQCKVSYTSQNTNYNCYIKLYSESDIHIMI